MDLLRPRLTHNLAKNVLTEKRRALSCVLLLSLALIFSAVNFEVRWKNRSARFSLHHLLDLTIFSKQIAFRLV